MSKDTLRKKCMNETFVCTFESNLIDVPHDF